MFVVHANTTSIGQRVLAEEEQPRSSSTRPEERGGGRRTVAAAANAGDVGWFHDAPRFRFSPAVLATVALGGRGCDLRFWEPPAADSATLQRGVVESLQASRARVSVGVVKVFLA